MGSLLDNTSQLSSSGVITDGRWHLLSSGGSDIVISEGACAELIITDMEGTADIHIDVERDAELKVLHVVHNHSVTELKVALGERARCRMTAMVLSPSELRVEAGLVARDAHFELDGAFILTAEEQGSVTVDVNHLASDCKSRTAFKGVASGRSHGSFAGLVYVAPDAQRTDSEQSSRNITIGEAHIETMPQLEIYADDVKCSHGATVGQMDSDAVLYMRQRGLSLADAKRLQIEGFVADVALHSSVEGSAEPLMELLSEKLTRL